VTKTEHPSEDSEYFQYGHIKSPLRDHTETMAQDGKIELRKCRDCPSNIPYKPGRGRKQIRCDPCRDEHSKQYMRNYSKWKRFNDKKSFTEEVKKKGDNSSWDPDKIPTMDDLLDSHRHDSGTGIDKGCSED
jgi:hypothetical protein